MVWPWVALLRSLSTRGLFHVSLVFESQKWENYSALFATSLECGPAVVELWPVVVEWVFELPMP